MRPPHRRILLGGVLTPLLFVGYVLVLGLLTTPNSLGWIPSDHDAFSLVGPAATAVAVAVLAVLGATAVFAWRDSLRATAGTTAVALLVAGAEGSGPVGNPAILSGLSVGVVLLAGAELAVADRIDVDATGLVHDTGRTGFALGIVHATLALAAFAVESGGLPDPATNPGGVALVGVSALFTAAVAALPVGILRRTGYVTPAVFVAGWFTWGVVGFVRSLGSYPYSASVGVNPLSPPPSPGYLVTWAVPLTAILVLTGLEYGCRRLLDGDSDPTETVGL